MTNRVCIRLTPTSSLAMCAFFESQAAASAVTPDDNPVGPEIIGVYSPIRQGFTWVIPTIPRVVSLLPSQTDDRSNVACAALVVSTRNPDTVSSAIATDGTLVSRFSYRPGIQLGIQPSKSAYRWSCDKRTWISDGDARPGDADFSNEQKQISLATGVKT